MQSRFSDPYLTRFQQPDSIIPNLYNPQSLNRFSYVGNNPIKRKDPTGHMAWEGNDGGGGGSVKIIPPLPLPSGVSTSGGNGNNGGNSNTPGNANAAGWNSNTVNGTIPIPTNINPPNLCQKPTDCLVPPQTPVAPGPVLIPSTPAPPWGTPTPMFYGPITTAVAITGNGCSYTSPNDMGCMEFLGKGLDAGAYMVSNGVDQEPTFGLVGRALDLGQTTSSIFSQNPFFPPSPTQRGIIQGSILTLGAIPFAIPAVLGLLFW